MSRFEQCAAATRTSECLTLSRLVAFQAQSPKLVLNLNSDGVTEFMLRHSVFEETLIVVQYYRRNSIDDWIPALYTQIVLEDNLMFWHGYASTYPKDASIFSKMIDHHFAFLAQNKDLDEKSVFEFTSRLAVCALFS